MNRLKLLLISSSAALLLLGSASIANAISLDFSSEPGSFIDFQRAGTLAFADEVPGSFNDIQITASDGTGSAIGLTGDIDGVFTLGTVNVSGFRETASLLGTGQIAFADGAGGTLTGDVSFGSISTFFNFGAFNLSSAINLSNLSYDGTNADLVALANDLNGVLQASFTAPIGSSLSTLISDGAQVGNYSGAIVTASAPVPEPSAALSFAFGALIVSQVCRRRR